ncbi:Uma2 family endonuclease [Streptomyces sp. B6B3]|uniref:Uma2 family endonuclease n=1 Tax=Streptomyces sp. B6B3 TaxID=3153570 RepID=UPI00325D55C0
MGALMTERRPVQATPENWMLPPEEGWTYDQVKDLDLPFDWELVWGKIRPRGMTKLWHDRVRNRLYGHLFNARRTPLAVEAEHCVMIAEDTVLKPDVVVFDSTGLDIFTLECVPVENVRLVIEVVSPGSRQEDRFQKPGILAEAGVPHYWRVERGDDHFPVVHEFWRHHEVGTFAPAPDRATHRRTLKTDVPFPIEIDLHGLVEF